MKSRIWFVTVGVRVRLDGVRLVPDRPDGGRRGGGGAVGNGIEERLRQRPLRGRHGDDVLPRRHDQCRGVAYHPLRSTCPHERPVLPCGQRAPGDDLPRMDGLQPQHSRIGALEPPCLTLSEVVARRRCRPRQLRGPENGPDLRTGGLARPYGRRTLLMDRLLERVLPLRCKIRRQTLSIRLWVRAGRYSALHVGNLGLQRPERDGRHRRYACCRPSGCTARGTGVLQQEALLLYGPGPPRTRRVAAASGSHARASALATVKVWSLPSSSTAPSHQVWALFTM